MSLKKSRKRGDPKPIAEVGSVWELDVADKETFTVLVVVVGELRRESGNYPCLVLASSGGLFTNPLIEAAVTTAQYWRRFT